MGAVWGGCSLPTGGYGEEAVPLPEKKIGALKWHNFGAFWRLIINSKDRMAVLDKNIVCGRPALVGGPGAMVPGPITPALLKQLRDRKLLLHSCTQFSRQLL